MPPLIEITCPVMYAAPSEHRNATTAATSSGLPSRRIGIMRITSSTGTFAIISVSIRPGATLFTVIWRFASSCASARVAPMSPALEAA